MAEDYSVRAVLSAYDKGFSSAMEAAAKQTGALDKGMGNAIKTGGAMALGMKGLDVALGSVKNHLGAAIDRFDTIEKFPKVMEQLGFSADKAADVMNNKLSPGIDGLPTAMDEIVKSTQQIALITGDLDGAADTAIALNNAFLASGSSAWDASRGLTQYTQMLTTGKVDMQSWRTLLETMSPALNQVAKEFGYTGKTAKNDLYNALKDGTITFDQFNKKLVELSDAEGGFAEQARTNSTGIRTSFQNIGTAVTKGVANGIKALEELSKGSGLGSIKDNADKVKAGVNAVFNAINTSISKIDLTSKLEDAGKNLADSSSNILDKYLGNKNTVSGSVGTATSIATGVATGIVKGLGKGTSVGSATNLSSTSIASGIINAVKKKYASGVKRLSSSELAWTQEDGLEAILRPTDNAILTPLKAGDSRLTTEATQNLWNFANNPLAFMKSTVGVPNSVSKNNGVTFDNAMSPTIIVNGVSNANEFIRELQKNKQFESMMQDMTVNLMNGGASLSKLKYKF